MRKEGGFVPVRPVHASAKGALTHGHHFAVSLETSAVLGAHEAI